MHISNLLNDSPDSLTVSNSSSLPTSPQTTHSELDFSDELPIAPTPSYHTRKRPLEEDLTQFAESVARKLRMKPLVEKEFKKFAKLSPERQIIWLAGHVLGASEAIHSVPTDNGQYQISTTLGNHLECYVFAAIVSLTVSYYIKKNELVNQVVEYLTKHPSWGLTPEVKNDKAKMDVIYSRVHARLTNCQYEIKNLIKDSIGEVDEEGDLLGAQDILKLSKAIINLGNRICDLKLSIQFAARVAVLHSIYVEKVEQDPQTKDYWKTVDQQLEDIRTKKKTPEAISQLFTKVLKCDHNKFGIETVDANPFKDEE
ncbi:hypothetical protein C0991_011329 [Blastosporella zonata]|nr:hypothetical protein C0991_011329 [Blastosporella zonata]